MITKFFLLPIIVIISIANIALSDLSGGLGPVVNLNQTVDLTWNFNNGTAYWKGVGKFHYTKMIGHEDRGYWYAMNEFCAGEHGGTHFDAPYHFYKEGWKVGEVPVNRLIANGAVIDLRETSKVNGTKTVLLVKHLEDWETENGSFQNGSVLLVRFGWSRYWNHETKYFGIDENGTYNFPGISKEAAEWIAKSGKFYGVGLDTASADPGNEDTMIAHRTFAKNQLYILENVKMITDLPVRGFTLLVFPMKLEQGSGAPLRVVAYLS